MNLNLRAVDDLIDIALQEDIGPGDITTQHLVSPDLQGNGTIIAKESQIIAGLDLAETVFQLMF